MMEHIRQFDWCSSQPEANFVLEDDLNNCVTERIIRNKFYDPMISSESDSDTPLKINWDEVFKKNKKYGDKVHRIFVPGLRSLLPYPKISALTVQQHYQCLKVICSDNPNILETEFIPRPTKQDHKVFEEVKETYEKEQIEYAEWAKVMWSTIHCIRALRPKPNIEMIYEAEFKIRAHKLQSLPKTYQMAAQIPLESRNNKYQMVLRKDLKTVNAKDLPQIQIPEMAVKKFSIIRPFSVPEPCNKHPCKFILPNESSVSILPLSEIDRELAQYTRDNGAQCIASENALKCLMEFDRHWTIPISVCETIGPDGDRSNVVVIGSEFSINKESCMTRTYKAFRHLLENALIPTSEKCKLINKRNISNDSEDKNTDSRVDVMQDMDMTSDEEDDNLFIDHEENPRSNSESETNSLKRTRDRDSIDIHDVTNTEDNSTANRSIDSIQDMNNIGVYSCTCKGTLYEKPYPRSFKKWQVRNQSINENYEFIVHCSHKVRGEVGEIILEPIPEFQIDMAASQQSQGKLKSLALSLMLRKNVSLLNARIDNISGDVITFDKIYPEEFNRKNGDMSAEIANTIHTTMNQLLGLLPGHYILQHEASHGANALLYATRVGGNGKKLELQFDSSQCEDIDEAMNVKKPPTLVPVLLPYHKFRKILPCAFTPFQKQVVKEPKKPVSKQKTPPQAIKLDGEAGTNGTCRQWPKRAPRKKRKQR